MIAAQQLRTADRRAGRRRSPPCAAALAGALLLTWTERKRPEVQEALIGILFVLASTAQILLLANDPHGGENLKDLLAGQILWVVERSADPHRRADGAASLPSGSAGASGSAASASTCCSPWWSPLSVQLVGVYLVFTTLIVPAVATYRHAAARQLGLGYALGVASYALGLAMSVVTDLPSSPVIVWAWRCLRSRCT